MSVTWRTAPDPATEPITLAGWGRVLVRGLALLLILLCGLILLLLIRLAERPLFGQHRPWTPTITVTVCRLAFLVLGIRRRSVGHIVRGPGAEVTNHSSWLDILALNAGSRIYFVAKSEVAAWPGIGGLARATGTVFIRRFGRDAAAQRQIFETRLNAGHRLLFFPEGTSTDGSLVLPFKSTLFAAFFSEQLRAELSIQPVTVFYQPPPGQSASFYGWWGGMDLGPHMLKVLAAGQQGTVTVVYHPPLKVADFDNRKDLAKACENAVRSGMPTSETDD
ncbi:MAG: lysophospholipid acyltransferase family protein [Paracoccaceae bacterium]